MGGRTRFLERFRLMAIILYDPAVSEANFAFSDFQHLDLIRFTVSLFQNHRRIQQRSWAVVKCFHFQLGCLVSKQRLTGLSVLETSTKTVQPGILKIHNLCPIFPAPSGNGLFHPVILRIAAAFTWFFCQMWQLEATFDTH